MPDRVFGIQNQALRKIGADTPVMHLIGFGKRTYGNRAADAHPIAFVVLGSKADFNIPHALNCPGGNYDRRK